MRGVPDRWSVRVRPRAEAHAKDREELCEEDDGSTWDRSSLQPCDVGTTHTRSSADRLLAQTRALASGAQLVRQHHQQVAALVRPTVRSAMLGGPGAIMNSAAYVALSWSSDRHSRRCRTVADAIDAGGQPCPSWLALHSLSHA
jgi:hypothetical protein